MRPTPTSLFVVLAVVVAGGVGAFAKSASGSDDDATRVPADAERVGFVVRARANEVPLLEASRPFRLALSHGPVHGEPPAPARLVTARAIVSRELARYPSSFLRKIHLRGVVFTEDLGEGDKEIPSLPNVGGLLLLDVGSVETDLVRTFHHELFHFFDLADDARVSPDPAWDALNAKGFAYGAGGRALRASWAARASDVPGFVSGYATSAVEEDKAETFAFAVARPDALRAMVARDAVVAAKAREIARRLEAMDAEVVSRLDVPR
jgi:hypothetical protein